MNEKTKKDEHPDYNLNSGRVDKLPTVRTVNDQKTENEIEFLKGRVQRLLEYKKDADRLNNELQKKMDLLQKKLTEKN